MTTYFQWQSRALNHPKWRDDGKPIYNRRVAYGLLEIFSACGQCGGHRLLRIDTDEAGKTVKTRLLYTPKKD